MIRGVNRFTIEVSKTGSPYFDRAICFVRPQFAQCDRLDLHRAAEHMLTALDSSVEAQQPAPDEKAVHTTEQASASRLAAILAMLPGWAVPTLCALGGAAAGLLAALLLK